jgi:hypothetical protein
MLDIQAGNVNAEAGDVNVNVNAECKCLKGAEPGRRPGERLFSLMLDPRVQKTEIF